MTPFFVKPPKVKDAKDSAGDGEAIRQLAEMVGITLPGDAG